MGRKHQPRSGSLQIWPRKKAERELPSVNWQFLETKAKDNRVLGFIAYKVGMKSAFVKDLTQHSLTKDKKIIVPVTILEVPPIKIYSARLYKNNICIGEVVLNSDKELKRIIKIGKVGKLEDFDKKVGGADNIRVIVYSQAKKTGIKKTPDIAEIGLAGSLQEKIEFVKANWNKEIGFSELFKKMQLIDVRGLSKGHGIESAVKRFGIGLKGHKSEKGRRRPGSLGPWHPAHVSFRVAMSGQLGMQTRLQLNQKILDIGKISEKNINPKSGFEHYGNIKTDYLILRGNVPGPAKRQLLLTIPFRKTKKQEKKNLEMIELR